mgnify:CR=1 FL=1
MNGDPIAVIVVAHKCVFMRVDIRLVPLSDIGGTKKDNRIEQNLSIDTDPHFDLDLF